jgi:hypothetical protein
MARVHHQPQAEKVGDAAALPLPAAPLAATQHRHDQDAWWQSSRRAEHDNGPNEFASRELPLTEYSSAPLLGTARQTLHALAQLIESRVDYGSR